MSSSYTDILSPKKPKPNCYKRKAEQSTYVQKIAHKVLMKLTPGEVLDVGNIADGRVPV